MDKQEWHYLWIKTLVEGGLAVESAETAFKELYGWDRIAVEDDPVQAAQGYLEEQSSTITTADILAQI
jgi:hypothetical protein